jgi:hypothetical protein
MIGKNGIGLLTLSYNKGSTNPYSTTGCSCNNLKKWYGSMAYGLIYPYANPDVVFFGELGFLNQIYNSLVLLSFFLVFFFC